jgi:3-methyl-2-oxobutanoate hydroxymethyltransferase
VSMEEMIHHAKAVVRGAGSCLVVCDMPFMSYQTSLEDGVRNAGRLMKETGVDCVKMEGGVEIREKVRAIVEAGIPVMGHIGLLPQRVSLEGKYRVQGKTAASAKEILEDALAIEGAGAFCVVLESVTAEGARMITERLKIPTLGKKYLNLGEDVVRVLGEFKREVDMGKFPAEENFFRMDPKEVQKLAARKRGK